MLGSYKKIIGAFFLCLQGLNAFANGPSTLSQGFQENVMSFRLQQGFFNLASDVLEDTMKAAQLIRNESPGVNVIEFPNKGRMNLLKYRDRTLTSKFTLYPNQVILDFQMQLLDTVLYKEQKGHCYLRLSGPLKISTLARFQPGNLSTVQLVKFDDSGLSYSAQNCLGGTLANVAGWTRDFAKKDLVEGILKSFYDFFNKNEILFENEVLLGRNLVGSGLRLNANPSSSLSDLASAPLRNTVGLKLGFRSVLNNKSGEEKVAIYGGRTEWMPQMGLEWGFDTRVGSTTRSVLATAVQAPLPVAKFSRGDWGRAFFESNRRALDYDAAVRIQRNFIQRLFAELQQAGAFNISVVENLIDPKLKAEGYSLHPDSFLPDSAGALKSPSGEELTGANVTNALLDVRLRRTPEIDLNSKQEIRLKIPQMSARYVVQTPKHPEGFVVMSFDASAELALRVDLNANNEISFDLDRDPIRAFKVWDKSGVRSSMSDEDLIQLMNEQISGMLSRMKVQIPFLKNKKLTIQQMGIESESANPQNKSFTLYLKLK